MRRLVLREGTLLPTRLLLRALVVGLDIHSRGQVVGSMLTIYRVPRRRLWAQLVERWRWWTALPGEWRYSATRDVVQIVHSGCPQRRRCIEIPGVVMKRYRPGTPSAVLRFTEPGWTAWIREEGR